MGEGISSPIEFVLFLLTETTCRCHYNQMPEDVFRKTLKIMKSELVVDVQQKEISIALLEDSRLVSFRRRVATLRMQWAIFILLR